LRQLGFFLKKKEWKQNDWKRFRTVKGWKNGDTLPTTPNIRAFTEAGIKPRVFGDDLTALEIFNYFMDPELFDNIVRKYTANPGEYSSYVSTAKLDEAQLKKDIDRYLAANIEI
jgi:hypothetical protein